MGGACVTHEEEKYTQNFDKDIWNKGATWKN